MLNGKSFTILRGLSSAAIEYDEAIIGGAMRTEMALSTNRKIHRFVEAATLIQNRYVAVCDVLGFKRLIETKSLSELVQKYLGLLEVVPSAGAYEVIRTKPGAQVEHSEHQIPYAVFSDTIVLWVDDPATDWIRTHFFFQAVAGLLAYGIELDLPLRAGIAYGECAMESSRNLFVGRPIVCAHQLEGLQEWSGGACHDSCVDAPFFNQLRQSGLIVDYPVPVKSGEGPTLALNWCGHISEEFDTASWMAAKIAATRNGVRTKYENSLRFYRVCASIEEERAKRLAQRFGKR